MHKENISALMDGEQPDNALLHQPEWDRSWRQTWRRYHLVRDVLRGDTGEFLHVDIAARVMAEIDREPVADQVADADKVMPLISEAQPTPRQWQSGVWWRRVRPTFGQLGQIAVAACVSLVVIVGVQRYAGHTETPAGSETPVFNTLPMMGQASPVSLGVPSQPLDGGQQQMLQEQHRRISALLQDYELQRRLHSEQLAPHNASVQTRSPDAPQGIAAQ